MSEQMRDNSASGWDEFSIIRFGDALYLRKITNTFFKIITVIILIVLVIVFWEMVDLQHKKVNLDFVTYLIQHSWWKKYKIEIYFCRN